MYCAHCGQKIDESATFCGYCGTKINRHPNAGGARQQPRDRDQNGEKAAAELDSLLQTEKAVEQSDSDKLAEIVIRMQSGDASAFDDFYMQTQQYVRRTVSMITSGNANIMEDAIQDIYITVYEKIGGLRDPYRAYGWLKQIVRTKTFNRVNVDSKETGIDNDDLERNADDDIFHLPEGAFENKELLNLLLSMTDELPQTQKICLWESAVNGLKYKEIEEAYGIPENTVKTNIRRARKAMQAKVNEYEKKSGVKLHAVPAAPVFYLVLRQSIKATATTSVPSALKALAATAASASAATGTASAHAASGAASATAAAGKTAAGAAAGTTAGSAAGTAASGTGVLSAGAGTAAKSAAGAGAKAVAARVAVGVVAVAAVGTGAGVYVATHNQKTVTVADPSEAIMEVIGDFEDACKALDDDAIKECLTDDSQSALKYTDLTDEFKDYDETGYSIEDAVNFDFELSDLTVGDGEASVYCVYTVYDTDGSTDVYKGYIGFAIEDDEWKILLCRASRTYFKSKSDVRFPTLIQYELAYNDEIEQ